MVLTGAEQPHGRKPYAHQVAAWNELDSLYQSKARNCSSPLMSLNVTGSSLRDLLNNLGLTVNGKPAAQDLGLEAPLPRKPFQTRSWRAVHRELNGNEDTATQLAKYLEEAVGDNAAAWLVLAELDADCPGTVENATQSAIAATS